MVHSGANANESAHARLKRWLPVLALGGALVAFYLAGLQRYLSFESFAAHELQIQDFVAHHLVLAVLIYMAVYVAVVPCHFPAPRS